MNLFNGICMGSIHFFKSDFISLGESSKLG